MGAWKTQPDGFCTGMNIVTGEPQGSPCCYCCEESVCHRVFCCGGSRLTKGGLAGAGKTYTASSVIDSHHRSSPGSDKLAYFYCNRAEESRRTPETILRTLLQQLVQAESEGDKLFKPVIEVYKDRLQKGQKSAPLTLKESLDILVQLTDVHPQTTLCIDALDEIDHKIRIRLLEALKYVMEYSKSLVKVFATTRMDPDILLQFELFPRIELQPDDNFDDIKHFVDTNVQKAIDDKLLLNGAVPLDLKAEICAVLRERSKGM